MSSIKKTEIKIEDLKKVSTQEELEEIASLNDIISFIEKEIKPLRINATTFQELYEVILILEKHWDSFQDDTYFKNESSRYIFALTKMDGSKRNEILKLNDDIYEDEKKAKEWYRMIAKKIHPDSNPRNQTDATNAMNILKHIYKRIQKCFSSDEEINND